MNEGHIAQIDDGDADLLDGGPAGSPGRRIASRVDRHGRASVVVGDGGIVMADRFVLVAGRQVATGGGLCVGSGVVIAMRGIEIGGALGVGRGETVDPAVSLPPLP